MYVASIDPGVAQVAWAAAADRVVVFSGLSRLPAGFSPIEKRNPGKVAELHATQIPNGFDVAIVEQMIHYPNSHPGAKGQAVPNDLLHLAAIGGVLGARVAARVGFVPARTWKGQVPKPVTRKRVRETLTTNERNDLDLTLQKIPEALQHNVYDAIGILLHFVGRKHNNG
jgi:hypothetical protein